MPLVRTDAPGTHHAHLLTRTISSSPAPSAFLRLIARADADVVSCRLVHRLTKSTHFHRASYACAMCCRGVRYSVRLSVCLSQVGTRVYVKTAEYKITQRTLHYSPSKESRFLCQRS